MLPWEDYWKCAEFEISGEKIPQKSRRGGYVCVDDFDHFTRIVTAFRQPRQVHHLTWERNRALFRGTFNPPYQAKAAESGPMISSLARKSSKGMNLTAIEEHGRVWFERNARLFQYQDRVSTPAGSSREAETSRYWWQVMQHYGAPTRLLDWTASPYVAAYFAVTSRPEMDGAVWMVESGAMGDRMKKLFPEHFEGDEFHMPLSPANEMERLVISFFPCEYASSRMAAQQAWFSCASTIEADHSHLIPEVIATSNELPRRRWCLKVIIPKEQKPEFLRRLWDMNITGVTLFPGLEGLGRTIDALPAMLCPSNHEQFGFEFGVLSRQRRPSTGEPAAD